MQWIKITSRNVTIVVFAGEINSCNNHIHAVPTSLLNISSRKNIKHFHTSPRTGPRGGAFPNIILLSKPHRPGHSLLVNTAHAILKGLVFGHLSFLTLPLLQVWVCCGWSLLACRSHAGLPTPLFHLSHFISINVAYPSDNSIKHASLRGCSGVIGPSDSKFVTP